MTERIVFVSGRPEFLFEQSCIVKETYNFGRCGAAALVSFEGDLTPQSLALEDTRVRGIEENHEVTIPMEPDAVSESQDDVATIEDVRQLHRVPADSAAGKGVTVVAMDSGVDTSHPVFDDVSIEQVDVTGSGSGDAVGHGTAVLGQVTRLAPEADLVSLRIFGSEGRTKTNVILRAYEWLHANTAEYDVVNMSWGSLARSEQLDRIHNDLVEKGVRDVVAAGNSGEKGGSPATADRAFSTGACTVDGEMAEFSSYNPNYDNPDVAAIGKDNRLARAKGTTMGEALSGRWVKASGTSFSAPEVAGMVAKYLTVHPTAAPKRIMKDFEQGARDIRDQPRDGAGLADYRAAVARTPGKPDPTPEPPSEGVPATVWDTPERDLVEVEADWLPAGQYTAVRGENSGNGTTIRLLEGGESTTDQSSFDDDEQ